MLRPPVALLVPLKKKIESAKTHPKILLVYRGVAYLITLPGNFTLSERSLFMQYNTNYILPPGPSPTPIRNSAISAAGYRRRQHHQTHTWIG